MSPRVEVITASAGSGKTHRLCDVIEDALLGAGTVRPEAVMAITYTRRAAAELERRVRCRLLERGAHRQAARLRDDAFGTTHAVCQRLLRALAIEGGLSPAIEPVDPVAGELLFRETLAEVAPEGHVALDRVARRLSADDWRRTVADLVGCARANGLDAAALRASGRRSVEGLLRALPPPAGEDAARDEALRAALGAALPALATDGGTGSGQKRIELVERALAALRSGPLPWADAVRLATAPEMNVKKWDAVAGPIRLWVADHLRHPRLHADLRAFVEGLFDNAARVLEAFQRRKRAAGVVDYDDMLAETARLLSDRPAFAAAVSERLDLLIVDEIQDVSPLQLDVIVRLGRLAGRAVWVGDAKQAIYGFQGAEPELMRAAVGQATPAGALEVSWRSRPGLVELCADVFTAALAPHGFAEAQVRLRPAEGAEPPGLGDVAFLEAWTWDGAKGTRGADAVAEGVRALLDERPPVRRRAAAGWTLEPLERRHVAVLTRTHDHCRDVAEALAARGIAATVTLGGLQTTPEALLVRAGLALLADPDDDVAAFEVAWLTGAAVADPDAWLARRLGEVAAWRAALPDAGPAPRAFADVPQVAALRAAGEAPRGPAAAVDLVLATLDLHALCRRWPAPAQRLANLEALRGDAAAYEARCRLRRQPCTLRGLLAHLASEDAEDDQPRPADADAVQVLTWHAAKGLEWPVVVLTDLDARPRGDVFGLHAEPAPRFDPAAPLAGRWLRYWPWPYGRLVAGIPLAALADATPEAATVRARERGERARLLYVGFTRACDRLALFSKGGATVWLDELRGADGDPVLSLPWDAPAGVATATASGREWPCVVRHLEGAPGTGAPRAHGARRWFAASPGSPRPSERVVPSTLRLPAGLEAEVVLGAAVDTGGRMPLRARDDAMEEVGRAVHAFLACDHGGAAEPRYQRARACLAARGLATAVSPERLVAIADGLYAFLADRFGPGRRLTEWPVRWRFEGRLLAGEIDLLYETAAGVVVVDHKAFPGSAAERDARAVGHAAQLAAYRAALEAAGHVVRATLLHFALRGEVVDVGLPAGAFAAALAVPS